MLYEMWLWLMGGKQNVLLEWGGLVQCLSSLQEWVALLLDQDGVCCRQYQQGLEKREDISAMSPE